MTQRKLSSQEFLPSRSDEINVLKEDGLQEFSVVDGGPSKKHKMRREMAQRKLSSQDILHVRGDETNVFKDYKIEADYEANYKIEADYKANYMIKADYGADYMIEADYGVDYKIEANYEANFKIEAADYKIEAVDYKIGESEWEEGSFVRSSVCGHCTHESHEGPCNFARDTKIKETPKTPMEKMWCLICFRKL